MTLVTANGELTSPTSTGVVSYSVTSFTPKAVLFFTNRVAAGAADVDYWWMVGASTGPVDTESVCFTSFSNNAAGVSSTANGYDDSTTCIFLNVDNSATVALNADMVSFNADGFTLNWLTVEGTGRAIQWIAFGGTGVSCMAGTFVVPNVTGNTSVTGVGFKPKLTLFFNSRVAVGPGGFSLTAQSSTTAGFGAAASATQQACTSMMSVDNVTTSDTYQRTTDDHCFYIVTTGGFGSVLSSAVFVSQDNDGFTINIDKALANLYRQGFLCIGGDEVQAGVGTDQQPNANGSQAKTGVGFLPVAILFSGTAATALDTTTNGLSRCLGVALPSSTTTYATDTFSGEVGTVMIENHPLDGGSFDWIHDVDINNVNRLSVFAAGYAGAVASETDAGIAAIFGGTVPDDYYVQADAILTAVTSTETPFYLRARGDGAFTFYAFVIYPGTRNPDLQIVKTTYNVAAGPTVLASANLGTDVTTSHTYAFQVNGTTLTGYIDGTAVITTTDGSLTDGDWPGIGLGDLRNAGGLDIDSNWQIDNFSVYSGAASVTQRVIAISDTDALATTEVASSTSAVKCLRFASGPTPTVDAEAELTSFNADGYTLNWTKTDSAHRKFFYAALGDLASVDASKRLRPIGINFLKWRK